MAMWRSGRQNVYEFDAWQKVDTFSTFLRFANQVVGAKLRQVRRLTAHESGFLKQHAPGPCKITMPGALSRVVGWYKPGLTDTFYPTRADLVQEVVGILQREVQALLAEGVSYIQLDSLRYVIQLADPQQGGARWSAAWTGAAGEGRGGPPGYPGATASGREGRDCKRDGTRSEG